MKHNLDNEASAEFKAAIKWNCEKQMVLPDIKRENAAKRAIQIHKNYIVIKTGIWYTGVDRIL